MKTNFNISESEKKQILDLHNVIKESLNTKLSKKRIDEQVAPQPKGVDLLKAARDKGCKIAVGGILKSAPGKPTILFKVADYDSKNGYFAKGDEIYIKDDMTFDVVKNQNGVKTLTSKGKPWACPALLEKAPDPNAVDMKTDSGREVATGNWTDKKDINIPDSELVQTYEQHPKYKNLWKKRATVNKSAGFTADQQSFINAWTGSTQEIKNNFSKNAYKFNPSAEDFATGQWTRNNYFIAPGSEVYFPADEKGQKGLKIFINVANLDKVPNRENCRAAIKTFVTMYKQSRGGLEPNAQVFADTKALVKLCKATIKFGGPFSKIDDDLNLLAGQTVDGIKGPTSLDSQNNPNPWRID
jgi:hypothetical protein